MEINLLFLLKCLFGGMFVLSMGWLNENRKSLKTKITKKDLENFEIPTILLSHNLGTYL